MQGFNMGRYYPPDATNAPSFNTSHPLGRRANKISQGILTVRFELPFAVWCTHCKPEAIVGQGVRFNAEKKKVGSYYSTPIWSFRMKHSACGGWWEIRTDPKNTEYVVVEGARRRDYGPEDARKETEGEMMFLTEEERERRRNDAFASLEGKLDEKTAEKKHRERVEELYDNAEVWRDPYDVNARLRREFRAQRKVLKREERHKERMQDKFSLGIKIADEIDTDRMRADLIEFGASETSDQKVEEATRRPLFGNKDTIGTVDTGSERKKLKSEILAEKSRRNLQGTIIRNSRAVVDPFLSNSATPSSKIRLGILKRKADTKPNSSPGSATEVSTKPSLSNAIEETPTKKLALAASLVDYDSD